MKLRKTAKAFWTIVYHEGKRIAEFVKGEFETDDESVAKVLNEMGYELIGGMPEEEKPEPPKKAAQTKGKPKGKKD